MIQLETPTGIVHVHPEAIDAIEVNGERRRGEPNLLLHLRGGSTLTVRGNVQEILAQIPDRPAP